MKIDDNSWKAVDYIYIYTYINLRKSKTLSIRASRIVWKLPTSVGNYENIWKTKPPNIDFLEGRRPERQHVGKHKSCDCICMHCCHIYEACATKMKKLKFHKSFHFFWSFSLSVHSALGPFGETYVHSAENTFIRPRIRSSGGEYVHSATFGSRMNRLRWKVDSPNEPDSDSKTTFIRRESGSFGADPIHSRTKCVYCLRPFGGDLRPFGEWRPFGAEWTETGSAG